ncbi:hypothetical protein FDENT_1250 [Fusarium denticulatum]|uniref:Uncharacterized protein n=1 Tax=Fusarium denticulatum TaxID=48507 RepID=A0A8H5XIN6_9HYPO|nr:hypothetical protein FDENT_1250 [Fusarium denticulatum]
MYKKVPKDFSYKTTASSSISQFQAPDSLYHSLCPSDYFNPIAILIVNILFSILVPALLSSSALGLTVPQAEDSKLIKRFDVPGGSVEEGFTMPEDTPDGFYRVHIDDDGVAHHTKVDMNLESTGEGADTSSALDKRQSWRVTCEGSSLDRNDADLTVKLLRDGRQWSHCPAS